MKKILMRVLIVLVLLALAFWFISSKVNEKKSRAEKQKLETAKRSETKNFVSTMAAEHNAVVEWGQALDKEGGLSFRFNPTYTIEVEEALISTDNRPILFFAGIDDIVKKGDKYLVYFGNNNWLSNYSSADIKFVLDCTPDQVKKIMSQPTKQLENYAVISQIMEVKKVGFQLTASSSVYEEVNVELEPSNVFIATGHCLDLAFVGYYQQIYFSEVYANEGKKKPDKKRIFKMIIEAIQDGR